VTFVSLPVSGLGVIAAAFVYRYRRPKA